MTKTTRNLRMRLYAREAGQCFYCNEELSFTASTVDHIIPKSAGGRNTEENCVLACNRCNTRRSTKDAALYLVDRYRSGTVKTAWRQWGLGEAELGMVQEVRRKA